MDAREKIKANLAAIKKLVFGDEEKKDFVSTELVDGTIVTVTPALESGASVVVTTAEGEIPAPDGEHQLADGTKIVTLEGKITEIIEADDEVDEDMKNEFSKIAEGINAKITEVTEKFQAEVEALKAELTKANEAFSASQESLKKEVEVNAEFKKQVFELLNKISEAPIDGNPEKQKFTSTKKEVTAKNEVDKFVESYLSKLK